MRKILIVLAFMTLSVLPSSAQIDLHSHAITKGYLNYIKANGAEMDEGFPIPAWDAEQHIAFMDKAKSTPCPSNWEKLLLNSVPNDSSPSTTPSSASRTIHGTNPGKTSARRRSNMGFSL